MRNALGEEFELRWLVARVAVRPLLGHTLAVPARHADRVEIQRQQLDEVGTEW